MLPRIHVYADLEKARLSISNLYFYLWFHPKYWWIDWHFKSPCCVFWILFGPFEVGYHVE